jgi:tetratricopeptide (TPR) repeat protein
MEVDLTNDIQKGKRCNARGPEDCLSCKNWTPCYLRYEQRSDFDGNEDERKYRATCQIMMVDFVQLHLPENFANIKVSLPVRYLIDKNKYSAKRISARYRFFDETTLKKALKDLNEMFPSMGTYHLLKDAIVDKYLYKVPNFSGKYIIKKEIPEFEEKVKEFKKMLDAIGANIRKILLKYKDEALQRLFDDFKPLWEKANPWWNDFNISKEQAYNEFAKDMSMEIDMTIEGFVPSIKYPYFELGLDLRKDEDFRQKVKKVFREWLENNGRTIDQLLGTPEGND